MELVSLKIEDMSDYGKTSKGVVYSAHVRIHDIESRADEMVTSLSDTSWIANLGAVEKVSYAARAERTVVKLVRLITERVDNQMTTDFGEFMVSDSAQSLLNNELDHNKVPLAELLKEKISGNPGFDFHTESSTNFIAFGEAKYSGEANPHGKALSQIVKFIGLKKDIAELTDLQHFVSEPAVNNTLQGIKAYAAAFSINNSDPQLIIQNALKSKFIDDLLDFPELYVIGVEVNA